ncbi:pheST operon leader peptide PheM [Serratia fonticola]|nr:pheST operon leader peptide PheM [Serratia fonticola]
MLPLLLSVLNTDIDFYRLALSHWLPIHRQGTTNMHAVIFRFFFYFSA